MTTRSAYATVLTGSKFQWGIAAPTETKTQLNTKLLIVAGI
jgi:hypothetical protein